MAGIESSSATIHLEVVTRTGVKVRTEVDEIQAPSVEGEFGVLPGHVLLLAALRSGLLTYRVGQKIERGVLGPGFAEVNPNSVLVLSEHFVLEDDIDPAATRERLETERGVLEKLKEKGITQGAQFDEHQSRIEWCEAQLALVETWAPGRRGGHHGGEAN